MKIRIIKMGIIQMKKAQHHAQFVLLEL